MYLSISWSLSSKLYILLEKFVLFLNSIDLNENLFFVSWFFKLLAKLISSTLAFTAKLLALWLLILKKSL